MTKTKQPAIIVDIDGTLANNNHRQHLFVAKKYKECYALIHEDTPHGWCQEIIERFISTHKILLVSGRGMGEGGVYHDATREWLSTHDIWWDDLFMRKHGDYRCDTIVKKEIYQNHIEPKFDVLFCLDDRPKVCRMWRELGLTVLQCNDREF